MRVQSVFTTRDVRDMGLAAAATSRCSIQAQGHPSQPSPLRHGTRAEPALNEGPVLKLKTWRQRHRRHIIKLVHILDTAALFRLV